MGRTKRALRYLTPILIILVAVPFMTQISYERPRSPYRLRTAICLNGYRTTFMSFNTGFSYELVKMFSSHLNSEPDIILGDGVQSLGLLKADSLDVIIMPFSDSLSAAADLCCSNSLENGTMWVMRSEDEGIIQDFNHWMKIISCEKEYARLMERFRPSFEPYRRVSLGWDFKDCSPYDELIKQYAPKAGWDWRMLTALIWQESCFRIEARSLKGAEGLLQMMPMTAQRFRNDDMLDPEKNLEAGIRYILRLNKIFSQFATDEDLPKFVLAAYSAGEGRVLDCIRYARAKGMPYSTWEDLENIIGDLRVNGAGDLDTLLQYGGLKGYETLNYVAGVYSHYDAFTLISPGQ